MDFEISVIRMQFRAEIPVRFPAGKAANTLRGALGSSLDIHGRVTGAASGLADPPRPYVFRVAHLDGKTIPPGRDFDVGLNLFYTDHAAYADGLAQALSDRASLIDVSVRRVTCDLLPVRARKLTVRFVTPTELKDGGEVVDKPEFGILLERARDRISALRSLYGPGAPAADYRDLGERAAAIRMTKCEQAEVRAERLSWSTGQRHSIGGFVGIAEYEGEMDDFVPWLQIAQWTGVGRQTAWGKGQITLET